MVRKRREYNPCVIPLEYMSIVPGSHQRCWWLFSFSVCSQVPGVTQVDSGPGFKVEGLGWSLKPCEKYLYIGLSIKAIGENVKYPRDLPRGFGWGLGSGMVCGVWPGVQA